MSHVASVRELRAVSGRTTADVWRYKKLEQRGDGLRSVCGGRRPSPFQASDERRDGCRQTRVRNVGVWSHEDGVTPIDPLTIAGDHCAPKSSLSTMWRTDGGRYVGRPTASHRLRPLRHFSDRRIRPADATRSAKKIPSSTVTRRLGVRVRRWSHAHLVAESRATRGTVSVVTCHSALHNRSIPPFLAL